MRFELSGFVESRYLDALTGDAGFAGLLPSVPHERAYFEANAQPRLRSQYLGLDGDLSFYLATNAPQHLFLINELYGDVRIAGPLHLRIGRQRVVWGSGVSANPTDVINPPKSPIDLSQQRTGTFMLPLLELTTRQVTATALLTPAIGTNEWAIPTSMDFAQPTLGGRLYTLRAATDIQLMSFRDFKHHLTYLGTSLSRVFADSLEVHVEAMAWYGPPRPSTLPALVQAALAQCAPPSGASAFDGSVLAGGRYDWTDQTWLALEYLYNSYGLDNAGYDKLRSEIPCLKNAAMSLPSLAEPNAIGHPVDPAVSLLRQHYLIATFQRPHLTAGALSDVSVAASVVFGAADQSTLLQLRLGYDFGGRVSLLLTAVSWVTRQSGEFQLFENRFAATAGVRVLY